MSIFSNFFNRTPKIYSGNNASIKYAMIDALNFPSVRYDIDDGRRIASVVICSNVLAQDIGRLPIKVFKTDEENNKKVLKDDYRYVMLHNHPNSYTDSYTFWSTVEFVRAFEGNSFVRIYRDNFKRATSLEFIPNDKVSGPVKQNGQVYYEVTNDNGLSEILNSSEILHFRNLSNDGLKGRDPKIDLDINLGISYKALATIDNFYNNGAIATKALKSVIPDHINQYSFQDDVSIFKSKYTGYQNANSVIVLPPYTEFQDLNINFADALFIETIKYNNTQVGSYYRIPLQRLGIADLKYSNNAEMQEDYVSNTISPILEMYRRELEFKLLTDEEINDGYSIEFETGALYITDVNTRMETYKTLFGLGVYNSDKICKLENTESYPGAEKHYISTGYLGVGVNGVEDASTNTKI